MEVNKNKKNLLRMLPGIDRILEIAKKDSFFINIPKTVLLNSTRKVVEEIRELIINEDPVIKEKDITDSLVLAISRSSLVGTTMTLTVLFRV